MRERIVRSCDRVIVYAYGDWITWSGNLGSLAGQAGLTVAGPDDSQAALVVKRDPRAGRTDG